MCCLLPFYHLDNLKSVSGWKRCDNFFSRKHLLTALLLSLLSLSHQYSVSLSLSISLHLWSVKPCLRVNFQLQQLNVFLFNFHFSIFIVCKSWRAVCDWFAGRRCYRIVSSEWYTCWWPSAGKYKNYIHFFRIAHFQNHFRLSTCHVIVYVCVYVCPLNNVTIMIKVVP